MTDIRELLPLYALDALELDGDEAREVEQAVAADPQLAVASINGIDDVLTQLVIRYAGTFFTLQPMQPAVYGREPCTPLLVHIDWAAALRLEASN